MHTFRISSEFSAWLLQAPRPISAYQLNRVRTVAAAAEPQVESKNEEPSPAEAINWATASGIAIALAILAMSVSLVRSEATNDLRILSASGADRRTLRTMAAASAASLALVGAVLGIAAASISVAGVLRTDVLNGGLAAFGSVPVAAILVGMPLLAGRAGWLLGGNEPAIVARRTSRDAQSSRRADRKGKLSRLRGRSAPHRSFTPIRTYHVKVSPPGTRAEAKPSFTLCSNSSAPISASVSPRRRKPW